MKNRMYWSRLVRLAFPMIVSSIIGQIQMLIDKMFLGRLDITCTSAVGSASSPIWTTMSTIYALTMGGTILISQHVGANEKAEARDVMASVFKFNNLWSFLWFLFWIIGAPGIFRVLKVDSSIVDMSIDYARYCAPVFLIVGLNSSLSSLLQVSERTRIMVVYGILRSGMNIVLDYALIFGHFGLPRMEVAGAALATTIAEYVGIICITAYVLLQKDLVLKPSVREIMQAKWSVYWSAVKVGILISVEEFAWNLGNMYLIVMLNQVSAEAAGIYTIVFAVELIPVAVMSSLGQATVTLGGQEVGARNYSGVRSIARIAFLLCTAINLVNLVCFMAFPEIIMGAFTTDRSIIMAAAVYLMIVGVDLFPKAANIVAGAGVKSFGDTLWMLKTQIFGTIFVIGGSSILVLGFHYGITALFWLVVADEAIRCVLNYGKLIKMSSKKVLMNQS